jgi:hypothetical protein
MEMHHPLIIQMWNKFSLHVVWMIAITFFVWFDLVGLNITWFMGANILWNRYLQKFFLSPLSSIFNKPLFSYGALYMYSGTTYLCFLEGVGYGSSLGGHHNMPTTRFIMMRRAFIRFCTWALHIYPLCVALTNFIFSTWPRNLYQGLMFYLTYDKEEGFCTSNSCQHPSLNPSLHC